MVGAMPCFTSRSGRKQWNIEERKFIGEWENADERLQRQLAEDGCPESQVVLAKQLLQEKSFFSVNDNEENARLGVFWLIKASQQGNMEATNILSKCLETGEGITEHNYVDVKACLNTSQNEKLAKRAARELFMSLSKGHDFITLQQLRRKINTIDLYDSPSTSKTKEGNQNLENNFLEKAEEDGGGDSVKNQKSESDSDEFEFKKDNLDWTPKSDDFNEKLTENHLRTAALHYSKGELPLVQGVFALTDSQNVNTRHLNYLQKTLLHLFLAVQKAHLKLLKHFSLHHRHNLFLLPGSTLFQFLTIFLLYPFISIENLFLFLPMCVYYTSFFFMIVSTLQMLQSQKEYTDFRVWSRLFLIYDRDGNLNTDDAEFEFCKKNLRPYGVYFLSLLFNLIAYPFIAELWIPQSEFAIISFAFTFLTLYSFHEKTRKLDFLLLFSFAINVLAKYPYETDGVVRQTWRFLDIELPTLQSYILPCFVSRVVGNGIEFCLNFRGFFYLLIPGIFIRMAYRDNWRGTYKILIPHCVTLSWWQVAVFCCQGATLYGLLRSTLALVGLVLFLPLAGIATTILPIVAILKHFADIALSSRILMSILVIIVPMVLAYYKRRRSIGSNFVKMQVLLAVVSVFLLLLPVYNILGGSTRAPEMQTLPALTWDQYSSVCQKSAWDRRSDAEIQKGCIRLNGVEINWKGVVDNVRIIKVHNNLLRYLNHVPQTLRPKILCYYGEVYNTDCTEEENRDEMNLCKLLSQINSNDKCHADSWNKYEFEISIKMNMDKWSSGESTIRLIVDDSMKNFTLKLQPKDRIWFSGSMNYPETIGSDSLMVSANEIGCINCLNKNLTSVKKEFNKFTGQYFAREIYNGFKRILNFVFNPVINFR